MYSLGTKRYTHLYAVSVYVSITCEDAEEPMIMRNAVHLHWVSEWYMLAEIFKSSNL